MRTEAARSRDGRCGGPCRLVGVSTARTRTVGEAESPPRHEHPRLRVNSGRPDISRRGFARLRLHLDRAGAERIHRCRAPQARVRLERGRRRAPVDTDPMPFRRCAGLGCPRRKTADLPALWSLHPRRAHGGGGAESRLRYALVRGHARRAADRRADQRRQPVRRRVDGPTALRADIVPKHAC